MLHSLAREGAIPSIPIYVDSPLAIDATTVFEMHPESFDRSEDMVQKAKELFRFDLVHYTRDVEESKALSRAHGPMIIIAASGMMENGRIVHHLAQGASDPRNTILVVGSPGFASAAIRRTSRPISGGLFDSNLKRPGFKLQRA